MVPTVPELRVLSVLVAAGLLLACCRTKEAGTATSAGASIRSAGAASVPDASFAAGASGTGYDITRTVVTDTAVRVVNLYLPKGSPQGSPVDVWVGSPAHGGKKLQTVPYGKAGDYFPVDILDPTGSLTKAPGLAYRLSVYAAGKTNPAEELISQGEDAWPGQKLTMVVVSNHSEQGGAGLQVFADDLGSMEKRSGFQHLSVPLAPAGSAVLLLGALAVESLGPDPTHPARFTPSTSDGKCIEYIESDTGKVHDPNSNVVDLFGATSLLPYVVQPGKTIGFTVLHDQQSMADACAGDPVLGPIDPELVAGERAYGFLYGPTMKAAKLLVLPTGK